MCTWSQTISCKRHGDPFPINIRPWEVGYDLLDIYYKCIWQVIHLFILNIQLSLQLLILPAIGL